MCVRVCVVPQVESIKKELSKLIDEAREQRLLAEAVDDADKVMFTDDDDDDDDDGDGDDDDDDDADDDADEYKIMESTTAELND